MTARIPHALQCRAGARSSSACSTRSPGCWCACCPSASRRADPAAPRYLDEARSRRPSLALANAARETLRMGDIVEAMLRAGHDRIDDQRPQARQRSVAHGQRRRPARRSDQALRHQADPRQPRRARRPPRHGDHVVRDQPRAHRRHHRQEPVRARGEEDQARAAILRRGRGRADGVPQARRREPAVAPSASSCPATSTRRASCSRRRPSCAKPSSQPPSGISSACARAARRRLETTSLHLDVLRDLKRIHSHICSVAYPVLEAAGEIAAVDVGASDPITLAAPGAKPVA